MHKTYATRAALFALGFLSIGTQIYLVREFMKVFSDNELIVGFVLAMWMLITGIGSYLGRFSIFLERKTALLLFLLLFAGVLPSFMVSGLDVLKVIMVPYGSMAELWHVTAACFLVQLPFCLLNGFLFSFLTTYSHGNTQGGSYAWESLGSMASGALLNFIFLWTLGPFQGLLILTAIYLLLIISFSYFTSTRKSFCVVCAVSVISLIFIGEVDFRPWAEKILYPSQLVISNTETPYGQVVVTKNEDQFNYYENGMLLFSTGNEISNEENVHYAMIQHPNPVNVLLISGGFSGTLTELRKYMPDRIDYIEMNPSLIEIASTFTNQLDHSSVMVHETDARRFIRDIKIAYDVVLVNLPSPSTLQLNRYYSEEFLKEVKQKMKPDGIISYSLPTGMEYVSEHGSNLNAILLNTLKQHFDSVLVVPAGRNYFLASDSALSLDIAGMIDTRMIETLYVNKHYIDDAQLKERSAYLTGSMTPSSSINRDFTPLAVWHQMSWWLSHFQTTHAYLLLAFIVILFFLITTLNPLSAGLFAGGFTLASFEIIFIFGLQVLCGYLFQVIGAIIMIFMLGLAAGAGTGFRNNHMKSFKGYMQLQISLAMFAIIIPFIIQWLGNSRLDDWLILLVFGCLAFLLAFIMGMEYCVAALLSVKTPHKTVAGNYSAEMFGSAAGAFAVTLFLIPSLGIVNTCIFLAVLNLATAGTLFFIRRTA
ncbi:MAG: hypothetical protein Q8M08_08150 [Bacteroidales bacterium]|nr:hypothetical protein [Bacteroidales bacterium]